MKFTEGAFRDWGYAVATTRGLRRPVDRRPDPGKEIGEAEQATDAKIIVKRRDRRRLSCSRSSRARPSTSVDRDDSISTATTSPMRSPRSVGGHRHRTGRQHQLRDGTGDLRGYARHGAEVRRSGQGQSRLGDLVGRDDAAAPRVARSGRSGDHRRESSDWSQDGHVRFSSSDGRRHVVEVLGVRASDHRRHVMWCSGRRRGTTLSLSRRHAPATLVTVVRRTPSPPAARDGVLASPPPDSGRRWCGCLAPVTSLQGTAARFPGPVVFVWPVCERLVFGPFRRWICSRSRVYNRGMNRIDGVEVFSATVVRAREELGQRVTRWREDNRDCEIVDVDVRQSSDSSYHCLTIVIWWARNDS